MKHKLLLFFLALFASFSVSATEETKGGVRYDLDAETHTATVVSIPSQVAPEILSVVELVGDDTPYTVTKIGDAAAQNNSTLIILTLPSSIVEIGDNAFAGCSNLRILNLSSGLETIGRYAFYKCSSLKNVTIPDNVVEIKGNAFTDCSALESISFGKSWKYVDKDYTGYVEFFVNCYKLKTITVNEENPYFKDVDNKYVVSKVKMVHPSFSTKTLYEANQLITSTAIDDVDLSLPAGLEYLGYCSLYNCKSKIIRIPEGVVGDNRATTKDYCVYLIYPTTFTGSANSWGASRMIVKLSESDLIDDHFVFNKTSKNLTGYVGFETEITLPANYNGAQYSIADDALKSYSNFQTVVLSDGVKNIGKNAFKECANLKSITLGKKVSGIGEYAFHNCYSLETVEIPSNGNLSTISTCAFYYCSKLKNITLPSSLSSLGEAAFIYCSSLTSITIPTSVYGIPKDCFNACSSLKTVVIPETVLLIGENAFGGCKTLTDVTLPSDLMTLDKGAFRGCTSIKSINFPEEITEIPNDCFYNNGFTELVLPNGITKLGVCAFGGCESLDRVTIPSTVTEICSDAFSASTASKAVKEVKNYSSLNIEIGATTHGSIAKYAIRVINYQQLEKVGDFYFDTTNKSLVFYDGTATDIALPETYNGDDYTVKDGAFWDNQTVESITMSDHVTALGDKAFYNCKKLKSIELSQNLQSIGADCFRECSVLKEIALPQTVTVLPDRCFQFCSALEKITYSDQLTTIGDYVFSGTNLWYIIVPGTVNSVRGNKIGGPLYIINYSPLSISGDYAVYNQHAAEVAVYNERDNKAATLTVDLYTDFYESVVNKMNHKNAIAGIYGMTDAVMPFNYVCITKESLDNSSANWRSPRMTLTDGDYYSSHFIADVAEMNYTRNFTETGWQALYLPYELKYDDWKDVADVATFKSATDDGTNIQLNCATVTSGSIPANTPCLIKPKQAGKLTLTSKDVHIDQTPADGTLSPVALVSDRYIFKFWGNYRPKTDMYVEQLYALSNGLFCQAANSSVTLNPFRIYLSIIDRQSGHNVTINNNNTANAPRIVVDGLATAISNTSSQPAATDAYYDLSGRRVQNPSAGIYLKNGKKVVIK